MDKRQQEFLQQRGLLEIKNGITILTPKGWELLQIFKRKKRQLEKVHRKPNIGSRPIRATAQRVK